MLPRPHFEGFFWGGGFFVWGFCVCVCTASVSSSCVSVFAFSVTIASAEALWIASVKAFKKIKEKVRLSWWPFPLKQWLLGRVYATDVCWQGSVEPGLIRSLIPVRQICVRRSPRSRCNFSGCAMCTCLPGASNKWT